MKHSIYLYIISLVVIGISGCAYKAPKDPESSFYAPPVGSTLTLHQPIVFPANSGEIRVQNGKVVSSYWKLDAYYSNCNFELRDLADVERTIKPDTFRISNVIRDTENVMLNIPTVVASGGGGDGGPPIIIYMTIMKLQSSQQPEVLQMSCQHWNEPNDGEHLNINQIRKTLGDIFTLTLAKD